MNKYIKYSISIFVFALAFPLLVSAQNSKPNPSLSCSINLYKVNGGYTLPYKYDGMLLGNGTTLTPGDTIVMTQHISNTTGNRLTLTSAEMSQVAGANEPIDILGVQPMNGSCSISSDKRVKCNLSYSFSETLDGAIEYLVRINGQGNEPKTSSLFNFQTNEGSVSCADFIWIRKNQTPELTAPKNVKVTSYADTSDPMIKYANIQWDPVPYASKYNLYTVGTNEAFFDSTSTNGYVLKFNKTSNWYFMIKAVGADGTEGPKSSTLTIDYPANTLTLGIPKNLRITQIENTSTPDVKLVHLMWDPVPDAVSYGLYQNAGSSYYFDRTVDTNLAEIYININSVFYYAVSAIQDGYESARSAVITIDLKNTNTPTPITPTPTALTTPTPTQYQNNGQNDEIQKLQQDVKYLREQLVKQEVRQSTMEKLIAQIKSILKRWFRISL